MTEAPNNLPTFTNGDGVCLALTVDGPDVSSVALTSDPGSDNTYAIGDAVAATVTFSEAVDITGTTQLELDFAGTAKAAACTAATNTTTMVCSYTVVADDLAPNGVGIAANTLTGGTIYATGSTTTSADLTHSVVAIDTGHTVDGIRPTLVTTGTDVPTTSTDGTQVILTFSEDISAVTLGSVSLDVNSTSGYEQGATVSRSGRTVTLTLLSPSLTIAAGWPVTVALSGDAVDDDAGNGNLALAATTVTNAVGTTNAPPAFSSPTATRSVPENSAAGTNVGASVTATDTDSGDTLTYTLEGTDATSFDIVSTSGRIRTTTGVTYDHEAQSSYAVTVKADDGNGGSDTIAVTITLTNVIEPPGRPAAPSVSSVAGSTTSLSVMWTAPSNTGPAIDTYDLEYRQGTSGSWTNGPQDVSGTSTTIAGLTANTLYEVQVLATNAEGNSPWSPSGSGQTNTAGNTAPTFSSQTASRSVVENSAAGTNVGAPVTATDTDSGDTLTYTLEGTNAASFEIVSTSGQIRTRSGVTYTQSTYAVIVKADDGNGGSATVAVTITVTVVTEPPPPPPPVNAAPLAVDDAAQTAEDTPAFIDVLGNDRDPDGDTLTVVEVSAPAHGTARLTDAGTVEYTPEPDYHGSDRFTYVVGDGSGLTAQAAVAVTVQPVNDPPLAGDDAADTPEDTPVTITVLGNDRDPDGDPLTVVEISAPAHGTAVPWCTTPLRAESLP